MNYLSENGFVFWCWQLYLCHSHVSWLETTFHIHPFSQQRTHARPLNSLSFHFNLTHCHFFFISSIPQFQCPLLHNTIIFYSLFSIFSQLPTKPFTNMLLFIHYSLHATSLCLCLICVLVSLSITNSKLNVNFISIYSFSMKCLT